VPLNEVYDQLYFDNIITLLNLPQAMKTAIITKAIKTPNTNSFPQAIWKIVFPIISLGCIVPQ